MAAQALTPIVSVLVALVGLIEGFTVIERNVIMGVDEPGGDYTLGALDAGRTLSCTVAAYAFDRPA